MKAIRLKYSVWVISLLMIVSCQSRSGSNHIRIFKDCLDNESIDMLNQMLAYFESALEKAHGSRDAKAYRSFLIDISFQTESRNMMLDREFREMSQLYKDSPLFADFKINASIIASEDFLLEAPPVEGEEIDIYNPLVMNPDAQYAKCLVANNHLTVVNDVLDIFHSGMDISPTHAALVLEKGLKPEDYDLPLVRLLIATHIYYEIGLIMLEIIPL